MPAARRREKTKREIATQSINVLAQVGAAEAGLEVVQVEHHAAHHVLDHRAAQVVLGRAVHAAHDRQQARADLEQAMRLAGRNDGALMKKARAILRMIPRG